jgi:hypothetical protein
LKRLKKHRPAAVLIPFLMAIASGCGGDHPKAEASMKLSHEQTLQWIREHKAWRLAKKTQPMWARRVESDEVGQEFQTADHIAQQAKEGFWLCVGVAGEPWFQGLEKIESKYESAGEEMKQFSFDARPRRYRIYRPKVQNWVAQIKGPGIEGFFIRPNYDPARPLYSPAGGYVVKDHVPDPYQEGDDVWLVQEGLFESTYELLP